MIGVILAAALTITSHTPDVACMAAAVYGEARGESLHGQRLVARVIRNRMASPRWPKRACDVIRQHRQFDFINHWGRARESTTAVVRAWVRALYVSIVVMAEPPSRCGRATYFLRYDTWPPWRSHMDELCRVGNHVFLAARR